MSGYHVSNEGLQDLDELWIYIAADNPDAASRVIDRILDAFDGLAEMPRKGHRRADLTPHALLFWTVGSYLIVYWPDRDPLGIVAVLHGARDVETILKDRLQPDVPAAADQD